jgi:hypothetical protein
MEWFITKRKFFSIKHNSNSESKIQFIHGWRNSAICVFIHKLIILFSWERRRDTWDWNKD